MTSRFRAVATFLAAALMAATLLALPAIILCAVTGCAEKRDRTAEAPAQTHPAKPAPASVGEADKRIAEAQGRADQAQRDLEQARLDLKALHADRELLVVEVARARLAWTAGLLQLVVIGFGALAFFSPVWRTRLVLASASTESAAVLALALRAVYAWLPIAGAVVGVAFVAIAVWKTIKLVRAARAAADHGDRMEAALLGLKDWFTGDESLLHDLVASVKVESAKAQHGAGVGTILARIRGVDPEHSAAMAALPVIRAKVAELPAPRPVEPLPHDAPTVVVAALTPNTIDLEPLVAKVDVSAPPGTAA